MRNRTLMPVPGGSRIAERLLAHARLCRQIAAASQSDEMAQALGRLADECTQAAADVERENGGGDSMPH